MKGTKVLLVAAAAAMLCGMLRECRDDTVREEERLLLVDTLVYVDTIKYIIPVAKDSMVVRYATVNLPKVNKEENTKQPQLSVTTADSTLVCRGIDSAAVLIPIVQKVYEDSTFKAYVSGYHPALDSIEIYKRLETIYIRSPTKSKRWSVGIQAGVGLTPNNVQPYIGVGVSYNILSF